MIMSSDVEEIALMDKKISYNYTAFFCSNKNYIGFLIENIHESRLEILLHDDSSDEDIQRAIVEGTKSKEISTEIRADSSLKDVIIDWKLIDLYNCTGKILLSDIIPYYNVNMWRKFSFIITSQKIENLDDDNNISFYNITNKLINFITYRSSIIS